MFAYSVIKANDSKKRKYNDIRGIKKKIINQRQKQLCVRTKLTTFSLVNFTPANGPRLPVVPEPDLFPQHKLPAPFEIHSSRERVM